MNEQSKGMKALYTVFLLAMTVNTIAILCERFSRPGKKCTCINPKE